MKISIAQTRPVKGDMRANLTAHLKLIGLAIADGVDCIVFPELSLIGYEPGLASSLSINIYDLRLDELQFISDVNRIIICVGAPVQKENGVCIGMLVFQPDQPRQLYSKKYLHTDEEPFFVPGEDYLNIQFGGNLIAPSICYELSVPQHSYDAFQSGANIYVASVAKTEDGVQKASLMLSEIARKYSMTVLMANAVGASDNFYCAGKSSIWDGRGNLIWQMDNRSEGIIILDTESQGVTEKILQTDYA